VRDHVRNGDNDDADGASGTDHGRLDPTKDVDLKVYSSFDGDDDWIKHVRELENSSPLVVFSKVWRKILWFPEPKSYVCRMAALARGGAMPLLFFLPHNFYIRFF
jgi:hypothetical protein